MTETKTVKTKEVIIEEINSHIDKCDGTYAEWYVGITEDLKERLFNGHKVKDAYIYREAEDSKTAREIEKYFIEVIGTDGGTGGGDEDASFVYAYLKQSHTEP